MEHSRAEVRETFDHFDEDDNGEIDREEFADLMAALSADMSEDELDVGFAAIDTDGSGLIDFDEFYEWFSR
mgnify:CR=1 FL=1